MSLTPSRQPLYRLLLSALIGLWAGGPAGAEKPLLTEKAISINEQFADGRITSVAMEVGESDGGPVTRRHEIVSATPYAPGTILELDANLSVEIGSYQVAFMHKGEPSLTLSARPNQPTAGKAKVDLSADGRYIEYRVTSKSAQKVRLAFKILPGPNTR